MEDDGRGIDKDFVIRRHEIVNSEWKADDTSMRTYLGANCRRCWGLASASELDTPRGVQQVPIIKSVPGVVNLHMSGYAVVRS
jgi:hypothetical protein